MSRMCPTCGCHEHCYQDEHAADEITEIPRDVMEAGVQAAGKYTGDMDASTVTKMVEDIHRAMHGREPLYRRADRDFTKSGLERFKS